VAADIAAAEAEVVCGQRAVLGDDVAEVARDLGVEADVVAGSTTQVVAEEAERGVELLKDDGLGLNFADLFGDDPLGHLLNDEETLLDDFDALGVADELLILLNNSLAGDQALEVVGSVEVVEAGERGETAPVVEGNITTGDQPAHGERLGDDTCNQSRSHNDGREKLGEHFERVLKIWLGKTAQKEVLKNGKVVL